MPAIIQAHGYLKLGKRGTAEGTATPISLVGSKVTLRAQPTKGRKWVKAKTAAGLITSTGACSRKYNPAKKGAYRMRNSIAETTTHAGRIHEGGGCHALHGSSS